MYLNPNPEHHQAQRELEGVQDELQQLHEQVAQAQVNTVQQCSAV